MKDIETKEDVALMVEGFYEKAAQDPLLGPVFNEVARVDWDKHLPVMVDFWSMLLFGTGEYKGQPFPKHLVLPLTHDHFTRWLELFENNLNAAFSGPVAAQALNQARQIARVFEFKFDQVHHRRGVE